MVVLVGHGVHNVCAESVKKSKFPKGKELVGKKKRPTKKKPKTKQPPPATRVQEPLPVDSMPRLLSGEPTRPSVGMGTVGPGQNGFSEKAAVARSMGTVYVGIDASRRLAFEQMSCWMDDQEVSCRHFLAEQGWPVLPGEHDFVIRGKGMSALAHEKIQAGGVYNIVLRLPGRLQLQVNKPIHRVDLEITSYFNEQEKRMSPRNPEVKIHAHLAELPYQAELISGIYDVKVIKEGYDPFVQRVEIPPLGNVELPVELVASEQQQIELCSFCARGRRPFRTTIDVSLGTPDWLSVRAMVGLAAKGKHLKFDAGLGSNTTGYLTWVRLGGQLQFFDHKYVAIAARAWVAGGGGPEQRQNLTFEGGAAVSVFPTPRLSLSFYPYGQFYWDRFPPPVGLPDKTGGGARFLMEWSGEWNFSQLANLAAAVSWAPGTERPLFSEPYSPNLLYPEADNQAAGAWYIRAAIVFKWPLPRVRK